MLVKNARGWKSEGQKQEGSPGRSAQGFGRSERSVVDQRVRFLIRGSAQGISLRTDHIEDEVEDQENEVEDGRDCEECKV